MIRRDATASMIGCLLLLSSITAHGDPGVMKVGERVYRDVIATCFHRPFLTDADLRIYFTNTRGRISTAGGAVSFHYPGIMQVQVAGQPLSVLGTGPNLLQVRMAAGVHDIEIVASGEPITSKLPTSSGNDDVVDTVEEFNARAEGLEPGDELVVRNGIYVGWTKAAVKARGTASKPIVVRSETPGGVVFRRSTHIRLQGEFVVFKGFRFEQAGPAHVLHLSEGEHLRVTQCQFFGCGDPQFSYAHILRVAQRCHRSRVDHCYFTGSKSMSIGLRIIDSAQAGLENRFDHNVFRDIYRYAGNGQENIQLGGGAPKAAPRCVVEYCLFDHAWGDSEIISNKSSGNTIRYNVATHCLFSSFTLRQGNDVRFEGNVMFNNAGGVRVFGGRHVIANNLFLDLRGAGVTLQAGSRDRVLRAPATDTLIAHNTFLNCSDSSIVSEGANGTNPFKVRNTRVVNNLLAAEQGTLIDLPSADNVKIERNLLWPGAHAEPGDRGRGALFAAPLLDGAGVALCPAVVSPVVDRALPLKQIDFDRWAQPRRFGRAPDLGANEVGQAPTFDMLPAIPPRPLMLPDMHRKRLIFPVERGHDSRVYHAPNAGSTAFSDLPEDFVAEWDHLPGSWSTRGSLTFSADGDRGYTVSWGGVDADGVPTCVIELRRGPEGDVVADGPDILHHRMSFRRGRDFRRPTKPRPATWYAFALIKRRGIIWLGLRPKRLFVEVPVIPVVVWQEIGPAHAGRFLHISQRGSGKFRGIRVWRHGRRGIGPPPAPERLSAERLAASRIRLRWRHGAAGRSAAIYEVYRDLDPEFKPSRSKRIAAAARGEGFDDFDVQPQLSYTYRVRAKNVAGMASEFVSARATPGTGGAMYLCINASAAKSVRAPLALRTDPATGDTYLTAPSHAGSPTEGPIEDGLAAFEFQVPTQGNYALWVKARGPDGSSDSFYFALDEQALSRYRGWSTPVRDTWSWRPIRQAPLSAGNHTLYVKHREDGAQLKAVLLTDDLAYQPASQ